MTEEEIVQEAIREYKFLSGDRGNFEGHWLEIAQRILPNHRNMFQSRGWYSLMTKGEKRTEFVFDSTAAVALNRFSAILDSLLTPRNQTWHRIMASDPALNRDRQVQLWFDEANRLLFQYRYSPKANFASQNQQNYKSLGAYGTGCVYVDELTQEPGLRYRNIHLAEIYFVENHQGIIDKAYRYFAMTARQALQRWPNTIPDMVKEAAKVQGERLFFFLHCVKPREDFDPTRRDYKGMDYASYYIAIDGQKLVSEGGFSTFPYAISRYEQAPGEVYGRSPAMDVLPAIKTLNEQKKTMLKQGHRTVDPVLLAHDDGIMDAFSLKPGSINAGAVTSDGRPLVHPLPVGNLSAGKELMDDERNLINDVFLLTIFQILTESPQMTATEVLERTKEKGILLAPTIGRQQSEYLGPMIERELDVLVRQNLLPPMPRLLQEAKGDYKIVYDSPLSRAQRAEEASGLMRMMETAIQFSQATQNPEALDFFNVDTIMPDLADIQAVPHKWIRDLKMVQEIRAQRSQQQQTQTAVQAAPAAAAMIKANAVAQKSGAK